MAHKKDEHLQSKSVQAAPPLLGVGGKLDGPGALHEPNF